jgi:acyl carrier protein
LGGDSLKAMEVIARLHASLGVEIPLLAFFEDPTVAHAAEVVDSLQGEPKPEGMTPTQSAIATLWSEVLQTPVTTANQNFFDLGGDSLKAMEVIARLHASLGVEIPLLAFFEDPTVAHAAEVVDSLQGEPKPEGMTPTQSAIATLWSEVLQTPVTTANQNFFDLGGDSLKAMEVIARLHALLGVEIPLLAFFEDPTVAHAAEVVDSLRPEQTASLAEGEERRTSAALVSAAHVLAAPTERPARLPVHRAESHSYCREASRATFFNRHSTPCAGATIQCTLDSWWEKVNRRKSWSRTPTSIFPSRT